MQKRPAVEPGKFKFKNETTQSYSDIKLEVGTGNGFDDLDPPSIAGDSQTSINWTPQSEDTVLTMHVTDVDSQAWSASWAVVANNIRGLSWVYSNTLDGDGNPDQWFSKVLYQIQGSTEIFEAPAGGFAEI